MADHQDVLIVGGGILGCATAYFLAKEGIRSTILERESVASCASGFAAGLLNPLHGAGIPGPLEPFAWESFRLHLDIIDQLTEESGVDPHFAPYPCMWAIFDESEEEVCGELHQRANRFPEFPAHWMDSTEVRSVEPRISGGVGKGMYLEGIRQVEPYQYTLALAQAAERQGAVLRHGTVRSIKHSGSRVTGVVTETGEIDCDTLVLAMGPWTSQAGEWLGIPIPIEPLKGQILRLQADEEPLASSLYRVGGGYIASKADGLIYAGTTEERVGYDDRPTTEARERIMGLALDILPFLEGARLALQTACLRPLSADGLPIIGRAPGWEGVYVATGAGRKGILLGPAMGRAVADLIVRGSTHLSVQEFSVGRFSDPSA